MISAPGQLQSIEAVPPSRNSPATPNDRLDGGALLSDKLVRDELLRSHRYQSLSGDTPKLVFIHLLLSSDSLSNAEATSTALSLLLKREVSEEATATILAELADHDLVRTYEVDGKRYAHIPRSRQRIRYLHGRHPRPPAGIEDIGISALIAKVGLRTDPGRAQAGREPGVSAASASASAVPMHYPKSRKTKGASAVPLPDWLPPDLWISWIEERKAQRKPMTPYAEKLSLLTLGKLREQGHDPRAVIELAIERHWNGLFPIKGGRHDETPSKDAERTRVLDGLTGTTKAQRTR